MKKIIIPVFFVLFLIKSLYAGYPVKWYRMSAGISSDINFLVYPYAVADNGYFLNYDSQRETWNVVRLAENTDLNTYYPNLVAGKNGTIFIYNQGESLWQRVSSGTSVNLNSSCGYHEYISNSDNIFLACDSSKVLYTHDGTFWETLSKGITSTVRMNSIAVNKPYGFDPFRIVIVCDSGIVFYGIPFQSLNKIQIPGAGNLRCVAFADTTNVFVAGDGGLLLSSSDFGANWNRIYTGSVENFNTISFDHSLSYSPPKYYGIAAGSNGLCFITLDNGLTWRKEETSYTDDFTGSSVIAGTEEFYLSASGGRIYKRTYDSTFWYNYRFMPNNIKTTVVNDGTFNSDILLSGGSQPGLRWPKDSASFAVFASGFNLSAFVFGSRRMASAAFRGEYRPGACSDGIVNQDSRFKIYRVNQQPCIQDYDYTNWYKMVPFGAPYFDVNHNGIFESGLDIPGMPGASQTVFLCMTDAIPLSHSTNTGFGGGTLPMYAEVHVTMWGYDYGIMKDVIFMKYEIINGAPKDSRYAWDSVYASFFYDFDIGNGFDNYMGCDSARSLAFGYCAYDSTLGYGKHPPAVGMNILKGFSHNGMNNNSSSAVRLHSYSTDPVICEREPGSSVDAAINVMRGFKNDGTKWVVPYEQPLRTTKYSFSGNPETWQGWLPCIGRINNCGGSIYGNVVSEFYMDTRFVLSAGENNIRMMPGDTQIVYATQLIARGTNNLNSVTRIKKLSDSVRSFYRTGFVIPDSLLALPFEISLKQNYPNPFNSITRIPFQLKGSAFVNISVYDVSGKKIETLINRYYVPGVYETFWEAGKYSSGIYFLKMSTMKYNVTKKMLLLK